MKIAQVSAVGFTLHHFILPLMRAMREAGHDVVGVSAADGWDEKVRAAGFRVETIPFERSYNLLAHRRAYRDLLSLFRRERFDIVHAHTPIAALIARRAARRAGVPRIVYTAHGFYFHDRMAWLKRALFIALEKWTGRCTDILFTQNAEDAALARRLHLCAGPIEAIGNGVDPACFYPAAVENPERYRLRAALETSPEACVILMAGRLVDEKGYRELIAAMRTVDAILWIAGERLPSDHAGSIDAVLRAVEAEPALARRLRLLGHRDDMPALYRAADIFTLPSHREGMPRSIIEAMMSGLPVVATDIRGSREEVVDGETGLLVPVKNAARLSSALNRLVADPALRSRMGTAGHARARAQYDERHVIARQLEYLNLA